MPRCIICDWSDTAGSVSNISHHGPLIWSDYYQGYVCHQEEFKSDDDETEYGTDDVWPSDYQSGRVSEESDS